MAAEISRIEAAQARSGRGSARYRRGLSASLEAALNTFGDLILPAD
jgi:hypothetical protein